MTNYAAALAAQFHLKEQQTAKLIELIDAGNTIPFIARYRKEEHGSLDDQTIRTVYERLQYLRNLDTRKAEVRELIEGTGNLTPEIEKSLTNAATLAEIDDIYRPFRPKRKTRAGMAKERGLEPLAKKILAQEKGVDPMRLAEGYVNAEKGVNTSEDALNGAKDIIVKPHDPTPAKAFRTAEEEEADSLSQRLPWRRASSRPAPQRTRIPCTACIMNSLSRRQKSQATAFWRWTAASARAF